MNTRAADRDERRAARLKRDMDRMLDGKPDPGWYWVYALIGLAALLWIAGTVIQVIA